MRLLKFGSLTLVLLFTLGAAACSSSNPTSIGQVAVTTGLGLYNQPANELSKVPTSAEKIYLSAEVLDSTRVTRTRVQWYRLPSQLLASEDFQGNRTGTNQFDFNKQAQSSYLASSISKSDVTWPLGEYRVEVFIDGALAKTVFFTVVTEQEASTSQLASIVRSVKTGDTLNGQFQLSGSETVFERATDHIYVQADIRGAQPGTDLTIKTRFVKEDRIFANFAYEIVDDEVIVVDLARSRFGKLWPDRFWPEGTFEATVLVNNVEVALHTFVVKK